MIFTLILWAFAIFFLYSGSNNKQNKWIAICFLVSSIGTLKEYFMDSIVPILIVIYSGISYQVYVVIDSWLTAVLYLLSPLCFITMTMYFAECQRVDKRIIRLVQTITVLIIVTLLIIYNPNYFKYYQHHQIDFWYVMSAYNILYAIAGCIIMFRGLSHESDIRIRRKKRIAMEIFLFPYFFWLFSIFVVHALDISILKQVWRGNVNLVILVLLYYIYMAYKEGLMGLRVSLVKYDWNSQLRSINTSTQYINHMLKNHATKISWSVDNLRKRLGSNQIEELDIIERSTKQLIDFTECTNKCLTPKQAGDELCSASTLIYEALEAFKPLQRETVRIVENVVEDMLIRCDTQSLVEVIYNIIKNASEAITDCGKIVISAYKKNDGYCIEIMDDGIGISIEQIDNLFTPFYTTKKNNINFGIGLPYCKSVVQAHDGSIQVSSRNSATSFILYFPAKRIRRKEGTQDE